ncbi:MAG: pyruvate, water dikinase regulatory protein [Gammaproteobacteria bacterium]|nr:pyruvate, water dikinase regulatory protein [Gammaproteobacteria bacterium]
MNADTTIDPETPLRTLFFLSCSTGITAEALGHSLMTQFEETPYQQVTVPFIDSHEKAETARREIDRIAAESGLPPVVFSTLVDQRIRRMLAGADCVFFDFLDTFIEPLERELGLESSHTVGRSHGMVDYDSYMARIDAINFALANDDGIRADHCDHADVILVGVSRTGKTPACLYLALQYGLRAANFPLADADLDRACLPAALEPFRAKLFGLTIEPERLHQIRNERQPGSEYASLERCRHEIGAVQALFEAEAVPHFDASSLSIEEIASQLVQQARIERRI